MSYHNGVKYKKTNRKVIHTASLCGLLSLLVGSAESDTRGRGVHEG